MLFRGAGDKTNNFMITEEKIIFGTIDELRDFFSFVGKEEGTRWMYVDFDNQLKVNPEKNNSRFRIIYYLKQQGDKLKVNRMSIFLRE